MQNIITSLLTNMANLLQALLQYLYVTISSILFLTINMFITISLFRQNIHPIRQQPSPAVAAYISFPPSAL